MRKRPIAGRYLFETRPVSFSPSVLRSPVCDAALRDPWRQQKTHGLTGSASVSNQSSILLVCSRMASKGLGSLVASALPGPPKLLWLLPRWYPAVPLICAILNQSITRLFRDVLFRIESKWGNLEVKRGDDESCPWSRACRRRRNLESDRFVKITPQELHNALPVRIQQRQVLENLLHSVTMIDCNVFAKRRFTPLGVNIF